jgi:hypothetical protein
MKQFRRTHRVAAVALMLVAILGVAAVSPGDAGARASVCAAADGSRPDCCFTNPQYAGVCVVQPGEGETCSSILAYLNNPRSQGKSYCGNTQVRGGWKQVACAE